MKKIIALCAILLLLAGCYSQIPAGHKGKILGVSGFQPEIYPPSKVWLADNIWNINHEKLFLVETTTQKYKESVDVLLKDKLTLSADVYFRGRIKDNKKMLNGVFNDMKIKGDVVTNASVYQVYAQMIVRNTAREVLSQYGVDDINKNYGRLSGELYNALKPKLVGLPMEISDITISNIKYPKIVTDAIEAAKKRRMEIDEEKASVQIALTKAQGAEAVAKATYKIKMLEAKQVRDYNKMINEGVTPSLLTLKQLEIDKIRANKWNGVRSTTVVSGTTTPLLSVK